MAENSQDKKIISHKQFFMLAETYSIGIFTLLLIYSFLLFYLLKIALIDDSDVASFQGYRFSKIHLTHVEYPRVTLL